MANHNLPFHVSLIAGGGAGVLEILAMYPLDLVKTQAQLSTTKQSMLQTLRGVVAENGYAGLYRGIISPILAEAPKRAVKFSTNETYKNWLKTPEGKLPSERAFIAGALAGATEMFFNCPFEIVKVRMQAKENKALYKNTMDCAVKLVKQEGLIGLYRGGEPQLWRNAIWNGVYFGLIGSVREWIPAPKNASKSEQLFYNFITGSISSTVATIFNTPFDVVKSRMQNQRPMAGQTPKYVWSFPSLKTVYVEEGLAACYKGLGPRLLRLGPGGGIMLVAFDKIVELLHH